MEKSIYLVGGAVRDQLLGKTPTDSDYVAVGYPQEDFLTPAYKQVGKDFPVFLDLNTGSEIALARTEKSTSQDTMGFNVQTKDVSIETDLHRRDISINSIAQNLDTKELIDPYNGQEDIKKKLLRHTSDAFFEDPVRVLRLARFRAMLPDWKVDYGLKALIYNNRDTLKTLQPDRIWKEVEKSLKLPNFHVFFETLFELGVLDIIFPDIYELTTLKEGSKFHRESSVFEHTMMMSRELAKFDPELVSPRLRLAVLFHDIAKPLTYRKFGSSAGHDDRGLIEPRIVNTFPRMPKQLREEVIFLVQNHIKIYKLVEMKKSKVIDFLVQYNKKQHLIEDQASLAILDDIGRIQDDNSRPKLIPSGKDIQSVVSKIAKIDAKDFVAKNPNASVDSIKQYLYDLRARECVQFYQYLKLNKG